MRGARRMHNVKSNLVKIGSAVFASALLGIALPGWADAPPAPAPVVAGAVEVFPPEVSLETARDFQSVIVRVTQSDGVTRDVTGESTFSVSDPNLAKVDGHILRPLADGSGQLQVKYGDQTINVPLTVKSAKEDRPISFKLDVMPVFMKSGCNVGGCHGSARGKDGFRLSLFGFDPDGDYLRIPQEITGRRVNLAIPEESLVLQKGLGKVQHTGGPLFKEDDERYKTIL